MFFPECITCKRKLRIVSARDGEGIILRCANRKCEEYLPSPRAKKPKVPVKKNKEPE